MTSQMSRDHLWAANSPKVTETEKPPKSTETKKLQELLKQKRASDSRHF